MFINEKSNKITYIFIIGSSLILILLVVFSFYTLSTYNYYKSKLNECIKSIYSTNKATIAICDGQTIDTKTAKEELSKTIYSLSQLDMKLSNYKVNNKYKTSFNSLKFGLDNNILMYRGILAIINSPSSNDISTSMQTTINYKNKCNKFYSTIKSSKSSFGLPKETETLINNTSSYVASCIRTKKDTAISNASTMEFENEINDAFNNFNSIKVNLSYYAESARKKLLTYDSSISKIKKKKSDLMNLTETLAQINVPEENINIYTDFQKVINDYSVYLGSFTSALENESSNKTDPNNLNVDSLYSDSNKKYNTFLKAYDVLKSNINSLNNGNNSTK